MSAHERPISNSRMVKKSTVAAALLVVSFAVSDAVLSCAQAEQTKVRGVRGWSLKQTYASWGEHRILITKNGFRLDDPAREYSIVAAQPDWIFHYFSDKRKIIFSAPISKLGRGFSERMGMFTGSSDRDPAHWKKVDEQTVAGRKTERYQQFKSKDGKSLIQSNLQVYIDKDMKVEKPVIEMMCMLYDLPNFGRVPLRSIGGRNRVHISLDTQLVEGSEIVDKMLCPPQGFKKAASAEEVMFQDPSFF